MASPARPSSSVGCAGLAKERLDVVSAGNFYLKLLEKICFAVLVVCVVVKFVLISAGAILLRIMLHRQALLNSSRNLFENAINCNNLFFSGKGVLFSIMGGVIASL